MKSFSQFNNLIEAKGEGVIPDNVQQGKKVLKKIDQHKDAVDKSDVWKTEFSEIERDSRGKKGEEARKTVEKQADQLDKKVKNSTKGRDSLLDKVNDPNKNRPPNVKKGELGKLYKGGSDEYGYEGVKNNREGSTRTNPKINKELQAKRAARINPKTGKATQKGVENFAINKLTKGLSTKGVTGREQLANAKKLASNPGSAAYKDIENKINTSDYAGKRAKLASADELKKIKTDIKTSKTIDAKVDTGRGSTAPTNIKTKTTKTPLNTSTRKGKITYLWKKIKPTSKSSSTPNPNPDQVLSRNLGASGMDSNVPGSQEITKSKTTSTPTSASGKNLYKPHQTPGGTNITTNTSLSKEVGNVYVKGKLSDKAVSMDSNVSGSKTTTKPVIKNTKVDGKTFKSFSKKSNVSKLKISSLASPLVKKGLVGWSAYDNYKAAKGSPLRKAVKSAVTTAAYYKGFGAGATLGTGFGAVTGPGAFVTGTAGGIMGGDLAQKTAGSLFNKVWKPPTKTKTKTSSTTNNKGVGGGNGKKDMKWTPMKGGVRLGSGPD